MDHSSHTLKEREKVNNYIQGLLGLPDIFFCPTCLFLVGGRGFIVAAPPVASKTSSLSFINLSLLSLFKFCLSP